MTKQQLEQLWDEYRDGTISAGDRAAFEEYLRGNDAAASMWKAESQWLEVLADVDASFEGETNTLSAAGFADGVLSKWSAESHREGGDVVGRIGFGRFAGWAIGIAAMVAFFVLGAIYSNVLNVNPADPGTNVVVTPPDQPVVPVPAPGSQDGPDAIGLLMASAKDNYALAAAGPAKIRQGFTSTAAFFDVSRLATLLDPGVPDPAALVEP
jgi:hypothetical protein